jgi:hypothetical protein
VELFLHIFFPLLVNIGCLGTVVHILLVLVIFRCNLKEILTSF